MNMKEPNKGKPHIIMVQITIVVLVLGQLINSYQERQAHQKIWNSLIEIRRDLNLSIENQNIHLQTVQESIEHLLETLQQ